MSEMSCAPQVCEYDLTLEGFNKTDTVLHERLDIIYMLSGSAVIRTARKIHELNPLGYCVLNVMELYQVTYSDNAQAIHLSISSDLLPKSMSGIYFCLDRGSISANDDHLLRTSIEEIYQIHIQKDISHRFGIYSRIYAILNVLFRCHSTNVHSISANQNQFRLMEQMLKYIQSNCYGDFHLNDLAKEFNLSTAYICRLFKKNLHTPFSRYLRDARLKEARHRLLTSKQSVEEIAIDCGFATSNHLIELFKEKYGETPGKYRKHNMQVRQQ